MPKFSYIAQTSSGTIERGRLTAAAPEAAREQLSRRGCRLVGLQKQNASTFDIRKLLPSFRRRSSIRSSELELMLQQISVLLDSGLELTPTLRELCVLSTSHQLRQLNAELVQSIEQGKSFAGSLSDTRSFPPVVIQLARVGEETGELAITLRRASEFLENRRRVRGNLLSALAYPLLVAIAAFCVAAYLVGWAIPTLSTFLHAMGRKLPAMTQSLLDMSSVLQTHGPQFGVILLVAIVGSILFYIWQPGRYRIDKALLAMPLIGPLLRMSATEQLASSVALMLRSGVLLPAALEIAAKLHHNTYFSSQIAASPTKLAQGKDFADSLRECGFGPMLLSMIGIGERTGNLPTALEHVAKHYSSQVDTKLKRISKLIEPTIIVIVGGIVGYVYVAFFMALLSAGGNFN